MTEEEYAKHEQCAHCNNPQHCQGEEECYSLAETKRHFLAGLKAGRPKWHDLRKDSNDLPKKDCEVVNLHENGNKTIQKWKNGHWTNAIVIPVIAWYEIPTFTDKE